MKSGLTADVIVRLRLTDTVEKLDFLSRSQFLRQCAGFKKKALIPSLADHDR